MKKLLSTIAIACVSAFSFNTAATPPLQTPCEGRIDRHYIYSPQMKDTVTVDVWLPRLYLENPASDFPVIYMHDGQNLFDVTTTWNRQSWEMDSVVTAMTEKDLIRTPVIVGVHSVARTRVADLMPERPLKGTEILETLDREQLKNTPLRGDAYASFVATTLRDSIENQYHVLTGPENRYVMVSSMGGLMSVYIMCEYPDVFGKAACLSTHWVGSVEKYTDGYEAFPQAMYDYVKKYIPTDGKHAIYFDRGTATLDASYGKWDDKIISLVESMGYTRPNRLDSMVAPGAAHEENAWKERVDHPLLFLLRK